MMVTKSMKNSTMLYARARSPSVPLISSAHVPALRQYHSYPLRARALSVSTAHLCERTSQESSVGWCSCWHVRVGGDLEAEGLEVLEVRRPDLPRSLCPTRTQLTR
eukprot:2380299-Rhodomonas_salina.1